MAPHSLEFALDCVLAVILLISSATDLRSRRVYNWVTFPAMAIGIVFNTILHPGISGTLFALEGMGAALIWIPLYLLGGSRAADVKLLMAVGAFKGWRFTLWALLFTALAGGVLGVIHALRRGQLAYTVRNALVGGHVVVESRSAESVKGMIATSKAGYMPYAPAIAAGSLFAWLYLR